MKMMYEFSNESKVVHVQKAHYDVYIGRPSIWGNPFEIGKDGNRTEVIKKYEQWLLHSPEAANLRGMLPELKNKTLACWCAPKACHGDVLVRILDNMSDK